VGFDWPTVDAVWTKVMEEAQAARAVAGGEQRSQEVGALLFAAAALARWYKVDSESALRETILRFRQRFAHIELRARELGKPVNDLKPHELDALWKESRG
jgi:tetrapyrrole methylase family protein/MazG family protein